MASELPSFSPTAFEYSQSPNPSFKFGQKVDATDSGRKWLEGEKRGWTVVDANHEDPKKLYTLMISAITPRPVAFVSSISADGTENLGLFSWFNMVSAYPPLVSISVTTTPREKDTALNIRATKQFTVNIISTPWIDNANACAIDTPPDVTEWPLSGLTKEPSLTVKPPRVKESAFSMECELFQDIDIKHPDTGESTQALLLGLVKTIHVRNDMLNERGLVDADKFQVVARLGDILYSTLGTGYRLPRPAWSNEKETVTEINKL